MHSALPARKLIYEIARNLDKSVGQTVFCCVKYITKRTGFKTNFLRLNLLRKLYGLRAVLTNNTLLRIIFKNEKINGISNGSAELIIKLVDEFAAERLRNRVYCFGNSAGNCSNCVAVTSD